MKTTFQMTARMMSRKIKPTQPPPPKSQFHIFQLLRYVSTRFGPVVSTGKRRHDRSSRSARLADHYVVVPVPRIACSTNRKIMAPRIHSTTLQKLMSGSLCPRDHPLASPPPRRRGRKTQDHLRRNPTRRCAGVNTFRRLGQRLARAPLLPNFLHSPHARRRNQPLAAM